MDLDTIKRNNNYVYSLEEKSKNRESLFKEVTTEKFTNMEKMNQNQKVTKDPKIYFNQNR